LAEAADASTALAVHDRDAGPHPRAPQVDKREHRKGKGMPVRDNLLE
jgi:hypothetical protein